MENKKSSVPKLRFPGFTGAWEQRKLGEVATRVTRKNKNLESTLPLTISAQLGLVDQISYFDKRIASSNLTNYILLKRGEFAYNKSYSNGYPFGAVKRLNNYASGVIPSLYIAFFPNNKTVNSNFMETYFETNLWHKEVSTRATEGARNHGLLNISPTDFMDINIRIPMIMKEQVEITKFLHNVDTLITLHQRKLEHLKEQKKGLLQKMFPKNGEVVPEGRFPGFTDDWEQRKLGEIYGKIGNAFVGTATPFYVDKENGHFYLESNNVKDGHINRNNEIFINDEFYKKQQNKWLHTGDIVMVQSGHVGHSAVIPKELNNIAAHALIMFRYPVEKVEPNFINYQFQTIQSKKKIENITTGNTIKHILASDLRNFSVSIPVYSEQEKVGNFLQHFDTLIALHQRKLEHLKLMKKGLLQQMFV